MSWHISNLVQNVEILPFNKNHFPQVENWVQKKDNTHAFLGRFNVEHMFYYLFKLLYSNQKSGVIADKFPTLKLLPEMKKKNLFCIFHCDAWNHLDLGFSFDRPII